MNRKKSCEVFRNKKENRDALRRVLWLSLMFCFSCASSFLCSSALAEQEVSPDVQKREVEKREVEKRGVEKRDAQPSSSLVGWSNLFLPGAGRFLLKQPVQGSIEFIAEASPFGWGYALTTKDSVWSLDGGLESIPTTSEQRRAEGRLHKVSLTRQLTSAWLQEIGIKTHFVNTFRAYRDASILENSEVPAKNISVNDAFFAPFRWKNLSDPWFYIPFAASTLVVLYEYSHINVNELEKTPRVTASSSRAYEATYLGLYPAGSGAPEEMLYQGFLHNEIRKVFPSPYLSIPITATLFALSHAPEDRLPALGAGLILSTLFVGTDRSLDAGITYHYWIDVVSGIREILLFHRDQIKHSGRARSQGGSKNGAQNGSPNGSQSSQNNSSSLAPFAIPLSFAFDLAL